MFFIKTTKIDIINYLIFIYIFTLSFQGEIKRAISIILIIIWLYDFIKDKKIILFKPIFISFLIFILYCLLSFIWTSSTFFESFDYIHKYWYLLPAFIIYKYLKKEYIHKTIFLFLSGIFISEIFSCGNYITLWEIGGGDNNNPSVFMHHVFFSIFLAITSLILQIKIILEKNIQIRLIYISLLLITLITLFINIGRTGQISFFLSSLFIIIYFYKDKWKKLLIFLLFTLSIIALNYKFNSTFNSRVNLIKSDFEQILIKKDYYNSLGGRIGFWILTKDIIGQSNKNLLFGVGVNKNMDISHKLINEKYPELYYNKTLNHFHSMYLEIITQFGLIGLILFILILISLFKIKIENIEIRLIYYSSILTFIVSSIVDVPFYKDAPLSLFAFILGVSFSCRKYELLKK
jgi:O-antigen ligase